MMAQQEVSQEDHGRIAHGRIAQSLSRLTPNLSINEWIPCSLTVTVTDYTLLDKIYKKNKKK